MASPVTINADYWSFANNADPQAKAENSNLFLGGFIAKTITHTCVRFSLDSLPSGVTVTQVRFIVEIAYVGGVAGLWDIHGYDTNGQTDPALDDAATQYTRDISGNLYKNDDTTWRATGSTWITLGGNVCTDVQNAKSAVNRLTISTHEEGDNDGPPEATATATKVQLEITYTTGGIQPMLTLLGVGV
jgi:hypothetical protein